MFGPPPLGPGAPPKERLAVFLEGLLDLEDGHLELILALKRDRWKAPIGGYIVLSLHAENLIREISPKLDAAILAQLLLNAVNVNVVRHLRQEAGSAWRRSRPRRGRWPPGWRTRAPQSNERLITERYSNRPFFISATSRRKWLKPCISVHIPAHPTR